MRTLAATSTMSTAIVSQFYEEPLFTDLIFKNTINKQQHQPVKRDLERKAVGSPVFGNGNSSPVSTASSAFRRGSTPVAASTIQHSPLSPKLSVSGLNIITSSSSLQSSGDHRKLDRSLSEPVPGGDKCSKSVSPTNAASVNSSRYKTELCRPFEENGTCKYGDKCQFAHGEHELRNLARHPKYKTELCRTFHTIGFCPYGPRCHFIHNSEECRKSPPSSPITTSSGNTAVMGSRPTPNGGSTGEVSPPSSLSDSPTCLGTFSFRDSNDDSPVFPPTPPSSAPATSAQNAFSFSHDFATFVSPNTQNSLYDTNLHSNSKRLLVATMSLDRYQANRDSLGSLSELDIYDNLTRYPGLSQKSSNGNFGTGSPVIDSLVSDLDSLCMNDNSLDINRGCGVVGGSPIGISYPMLNRLACGEE